MHEVILIERRFNLSPATPPPRETLSFCSTGTQTRRVTLPFPLAVPPQGRKPQLLKRALHLWPQAVLTRALSVLPSLACRSRSRADLSSTLPEMALPVLSSSSWEMPTPLSLNLPACLSGPPAYSCTSGTPKDFMQTPIQVQHTIVSLFVFIHLANIY